MRQLNRRRKVGGFFVAFAVASSPLLPITAAQAGTASADDVLADVVVQSENNASSYDRDLFAHWSDIDGDGCDTRAEVLMRDTRVPVTYTSTNGCTVSTGDWLSMYDGHPWTAASDVDIDHLVPLAEAWESGASSWTAAQREAYANDLTFAGALVVMTDNLNQSKGARDAAEWLPPQEQCTYLSDWLVTKWRWNLTMDPVEAQVLENKLVTDCGNPSLALPSQAGTSSPIVPASNPTTPTYQQLFSDVPASHNFFASVGWLAASGVTGGFGDGTFRPNAPVTRGQFAAFLFRYSNPGERGPACTRQWFSDVPKSSSFCGYITWLAGTGISAGYADGTFRSSAPISRGEIAAMLQRYRATAAPARATCDSRRFTDVRVAFCGSITWLADTNITGGYGDGSFRPNLSVNRGQFAAFLDRYNRIFEPSNPPIVVSPPPEPKPTPTPKPTPPPKPTKPSNPGNSKNCSDFSTWSSAQSWFNKYYPYYGDVAGLDRDGDRIACETLPGAP
ncbi:S-layer homology domain-containing protein [Zhihengliuella flava]|uniref:SLH domain-containing protein n=1 Tax=Zhihengliuella flava TaxID=1285193 RepID=A0A931DE62_9MICC|nr:S-layer homology domain-containing protein [Zhihengliuella flava]MBG6085170.1 hypothetical protein [Zhihengliuella flava]